jgi:hypothetical protein
MLTVGVPQYRGSLKIGGLREFTFESTRVLDDHDVAFSESPLPCESGETLTRMNLRICNLPQSASLSQFTSLKHLDVECWTADARLVQLLEGLTVPLCSLKATVEIPCPNYAQEVGMTEISMAKYWDLLSCSALAHLEKICLRIHCHLTGMNEPSFSSYYVDNCMKVVTKMADKMQSLEDVELWGGLDVGKVHVLCQLQNLKRLRWFIAEDRYVKCMGIGDLGNQVVGMFNQMGKELESVVVEFIYYDISDGTLIEDSEYEE